MGKYTVIARIKPTNQNKTADFTFSINFCFLVPISRGGNARFAHPAGCCFHLTQSVMRKVDESDT